MEINTQEYFFLYIVSIYWIRLKWMNEELFTVLHLWWLQYKMYPSIFHFKVLYFNGWRGLWVKAFKRMGYSRHFILSILIFINHNKSALNALHIIDPTITLIKSSTAKYPSQSFYDTALTLGAKRANPLYFLFPSLLSVTWLWQTNYAHYVHLYTYSFCVTCQTVLL